MIMPRKSKVLTAVVISFFLFSVFPTIEIACCCDHPHLAGDKKSLPYFLTSYVVPGHASFSGSHCMHASDTILHEEAVTNFSLVRCADHEHTLTGIDSGFSLLPIRFATHTYSVRCCAAIVTTSNSPSFQPEEPYLGFNRPFSNTTLSSKTTTVLLI
jgi:hypothetical protein